MFNWAAATTTAVLLIAANAPAQTPAPLKSSSTATPAKLSPTPTPTPTPVPVPATAQLLDSLGQADLQAAIALLKTNFANPDAISETELNRATLTGLLLRMPGALVLLPARENAAEPAAPFYSEVFEGRTGYVRCGGLTAANLKELDKKLEEMKKLGALIVDLRDSAVGDFATAAEFAKRFCPKGKTLFSLRKPAARQDRVFNSDRDPAFQGLATVLIDGDTAGGAEALGAALRFYNKALLIGQPTAGRAVEYADLPLPSGTILRVASAAALGPGGQQLFPGGIKPDLPVEMPASEKRQIFRLSLEKGMAPFVYESERPHLNEAALIAGTNPELDAAGAQRRAARDRDKQPARDPVMQRAIDLVTSLEIYQKP
ncbi:MAG: S41 family peptidase [Chthoniobacterales bacterium]